jgi:predicted phage terminase large subunit-like protein
MIPADFQPIFNRPGAALSIGEWEGFVCGMSFKDFVKRFWECVPGAGKLTWNWHMDVLCEELQFVAERVFAGLPRLHDQVFNVPFGTSKSTVCSILFPAWTWTRMPSARHIIATHTHALVLDFAYKTRAVIESDKYQEIFPNVQLTRDSGEIYSNTAGGEVRACTVGGKTPMGFHAHFIGIDDPIDPQGARSELELETARKFMTEIIPSRKVDKKITVTTLIMQRIDYRDPTAVMLEGAKMEGAFPVRHICLPGELTEDVKPPELAAKYVDGLMDVNRLPWSVLKDYQVKLGAYAYAGQVLQKPMPPGGGMFKEQYFNQRPKAAPYAAKRIRYWDRASTQDGGCYTAGVLIAKDEEGNYYVEHVVHGQWEPTERNQRMRACALRDRSRYGPKHDPIIYVEHEGGSSGVDAWKEVAKALDGFRVMKDQVTGKKDVRAEPWSCQLAAGNVYIVEDGTWDVAGYVQEHCLFRPDPTVTKRMGKYKDQVDASSGAYNLLSGSRTPEAMRTLTFGTGRKTDNKKQLRIVVVGRDELANFVEEETPCLLVSIRDPKKGAVAAVNGDGLNHHSLPVALGGMSNGIHEAVRSEPSLPLHGISRLVDFLVLPFADLDPAEHQKRVELGDAKWDDILPLYDATAAEVVMKADQGRELWRFLGKKRTDPKHEVIVIQDNGDKDRRALSTAFAICDLMRLMRGPTIWRPGLPDWKAGEKEAPLNRHCYEMVKSTRG